MNTFSLRVRCLIELPLTKLSVAAASVGDACGPMNGDQIRENRLQYGADHVRDSIDGSAYKGFTQLFGLEARQDIGERFDIGLHGGMLHSFKNSARDYQLGVSVGFKLAENSWLSVGYNQRGFVDRDFIGSEYRAEGLYLNLRVKFDQDTFNLNDRSGGQLAPLSGKP